MDTPVLVVNFKTYRNGSRSKAESLAVNCEETAEKLGKNIVLAVQNTDIHRISEKVDLPVFAQHSDSNGFGAHTGKDIIPTLKYNGAEGVIINHSEDQESIEEIGKIVDKAREHNLTSIVCVDSSELAEKVSAFEPDYIAYEPEELIGGDVSVSKARPEILEKVVEHVELPVLAGAGVKTVEDVKKTLELGGKGILVASGIVKADDQIKALENLLKPF